MLYYSVCQNVTEHIEEYKHTNKNVTEYVREKHNFF